MEDFKDFKEGIVSSLRDKIRAALDLRKQEIAGSIFNEAKDDNEEYKKFFSSALKKFGVKSPSELEGKKKKEFYDYVDKNWTSDSEKDGKSSDLNEGLDTKSLEIVKTYVNKLADIGSKAKKEIIDAASKMKSIKVKDLEIEIMKIMDKLNID